MLSTHSFNALLKTLEEPPPHVKFLLATTDPQKLPVTVLSRCLQFHLRRLPLPLIYDRLARDLHGRERGVRAGGVARHRARRRRQHARCAVAARPGARVRRRPCDRSRSAHAAGHARPQARAGASSTALAVKDGAALMQQVARSRRARARLPPGARRTVGRDPAHGVAAGAAGPAARRGRGRGRGCCASSRRSSRRRTCSCCTRSRSTRAATSITRPMRARVSRWRCCACLRSVRRPPPRATRRSEATPRAIARTRRATPMRMPAASKSSRPRRDGPIGHAHRRRARPAGHREATSRRTACCSSAAPVSCGCGSIPTGRSVPPAADRADDWRRRCRSYFGEPIRLEITQAEVAAHRRRADASPARCASQPKTAQRAAEQAIDSDPAVRAMREVVRRDGPSRVR